MEETSRKIMDVEEMMTYGKNLIEFLKEEKDGVAFKHFLLQSEALQSQCSKDLNEIQKSIEDHGNKIDASKKKSIAAEAESAADEDLDTLQMELEKELQIERMLREDLRGIVKEIDDLDLQRVAIEEKTLNLKKFERDDTRSQMKLSMYASVTNIIPCVDDESTISGYIVEKDKKVVEKFEFDPSKVTAFNTCNRTWKMISS